MTGSESISDAEIAHQCFDGRLSCNRQPSPHKRLNTTYSLWSIPKEILKTATQKGLRDNICHFKPFLPTFRTACIFAIKPLLFYRPFELDPLKLADKEQITYLLLLQRLQ